MNTSAANRRFLTAVSGTVTGPYLFGEVSAMSASATKVTLHTSQIAIQPQRFEEADDDKVMAAFLEIEPYYRATNRKLADL